MHVTGHVTYMSAQSQLGQNFCGGLFTHLAVGMDAIDVDAAGSPSTY